MNFAELVVVAGLLMSVDGLLISVDFSAGDAVAAGGGVVAAGASLERDVGGFPCAATAPIISVVIAVVTNSFFNMQSLLYPCRKSRLPSLQTE
jgi:hypothetical protein